MRVSATKLVTQGLMMLVSFHWVACNTLLDVDLDRAMIPEDRVFSDDVVATSAMDGVYAGMFDRLSFASGSNASITTWSGLLADELETYSKEPAAVEFAENEIHPANESVLALWSSMYKTLYQANAVIEGVAASPALTPNVKKQLDGEARFIRAFCNFYLANFFGDVPLNLTTDYTVNALAHRTPTADIYRQIIDDLALAEQELSVDDGTDRSRPNRATVLAFKARVALFRNDWETAAATASTVIADERYALVTLDQVFKINSREAIWQLRPVDSYITQEASYSILFMDPAGADNGNALRPDFVDSFVGGDRRRAWIGSYTEGENTWYYPFKYTIRTGASSIVEASTLFRLAELYLIRAEARLRHGDRAGAMADIDSIRNRAGLPLVSTGAQNVFTDSLLSLVEHERRMEFFAEWGHRWLDLKRLAKSASVLGRLKPHWGTGDELLPLPQIERNRNPNLGDQNPGYF